MIPIMKTCHNPVILGVTITPRLSRALTGQPRLWSASRVREIAADFSGKGIVQTQKRSFYQSFHQCSRARRSSGIRLRALTSTSRPSKSSWPRLSIAPTIQKRLESSTAPETIPYSSLSVGVPKETYPDERRVAITPQNVVQLLKKGFARVFVERGAGAEAQFPDEIYEQAGATLVDRETVWADSDILLKVRAPDPDTEVKKMRDGATVISFLFPVQNKNIVDALATRHATSFAMDMVPRISRAQVFDALR